jgi:acetyltransferase-like isoleucine patch superfamily enzyme
MTTHHSPSLLTRLAGLPGQCLLIAQKLQALCIRRHYLGRFKQAGRRIAIGRQVDIHEPGCMTVEDDVIIANFVSLRALSAYPWAEPPQSFSPEITLGAGCFINNFTQISCARRVTIGARVMIAERCFIADNNHVYTDPDRSIRVQPLDVPGEVHIGDDSWLGVNVCVVGAVRIGRHCVVGANSVVTTDLPDYCVAAGAPARILKQYDREQRAWIRPPAQA